MRILLDSNACSHLMRGHDQVAEAHALETGADLISADRHFEYVDGIAWVRVALESTAGG